MGQRKFTLYKYIHAQRPILALLQGCGYQRRLKGSTRSRHLAISRIDEPEASPREISYRGFGSLALLTVGPKVTLENTSSRMFVVLCG
jgi:hypothetical protein